MQTLIRCLGSARTAELPIVATSVWAARLAQHADLGDARRERRMARILAQWADRVGATIPDACGTWSATKAAYRFLENSAVAGPALIASQAEATRVACLNHARILCIQDTTVLNYSSLHQTRGLGPIGKNSAEGLQGLFVHSLLATTADGLPLGLLHQSVYARALQRPPAAQRKGDPIEAKESVRWRDGVQAAQQVFAAVPAAQRPSLLDIADRECDIHEVLIEPRAAGDGFVIRCNQNRCVTEEDEALRAYEAVAQAVCRGTNTVPLARTSKHKARKAQLEYRAVAVELQPHNPHHRERRPVRLTLVEVREIHPPADVTEPLLWRLWTTLPVQTLAQAQEIARLYMLRWRIEDFHRVLKDGCRVEELALESAPRLAKAIALYSAVAVRVLALRDLARREPDAPCTCLLTDEEWRVVWMVVHQQAPDTNATPPPLRQAVLWIGRLGGHLNRKSDGMPGVTTLWRGLRALELMLMGYRVAKRQ